MQNTTNIKLDFIKVDEFAILQNEIVFSTKTGFKTDFIFRLVEKKRSIGCVISLSLINEDNILLKLKTTVAFGMYEEFYNSLINDNKLNAPKEFLVEITEIAINIVRGILFTKLEDTIFNKILIPIFDVSEIINEDEVFSLNKDKE
ncbi:hypothetical protein [Chryseobacterium sp.]|uniref:hypothetical protein n=1 Tax=Chryseobacterium sp. TaxID=1871047 RepID=UPI0031E30E62